jgi:hypothetical protein
MNTDLVLGYQGICDMNCIVIATINTCSSIAGNLAVCDSYMNRFVSDKKGRGLNRNPGRRIAFYNTILYDSIEGTSNNP